MKKIKKHFGFVAIAMSFVFIFNPNIHLIDLLPDAIGYLLLCAGLSQLADMAYYLQDSLKLFRRLFFLQCLKLAALFWSFAVVSVEDRASSILTFTFVFAILEVLLLVPAYNKLFSGINYLSERGGFSINTKSIRSYTTFFVIFKATFNVLPELAALTQYPNDNLDPDSIWVRIEWFDNIHLLRGFAFVPAIIVSTVWLIKGLTAISKISKNKDFISYLKDRYITEILPQDELFLRKSINFAFLTFSLGILLCIDFFIGISTGYMNDIYVINLIPDFFAVVCVLFGVWGLRKYIPKTKKVATAVSIIYAAVNTLKEYIATSYFRKHTVLDLRIDEQANQDYIIVKTGAIIEAIAFTLFIFAIVLVLREIVANHTGYEPITENAAENKNTQEKIAYIRSRLNRKLTVALCFGALAALFNALYYFIIPLSDYAWIINFAVSAIFAIVFIPKLFLISDEIEYKYMI